MPRASRSCADFSRLIMPSCIPVSIALFICFRSPVLIMFRIPGVTNMSSRIAIRPGWSCRGMSRWESTQKSESASRIRACVWIWGSKNWTILLIVWTLPEVWSVENTRCPVSARFRAASTVSASRISPTITIFGSSRIAARIAVTKDSVSLHTSRCENMLFFGVKINSIGSSIVMMCSERDLLISSMSDTMVVDFPLPVGPTIAIFDGRQQRVLVTFA